MSWATTKTGKAKAIAAAIIGATALRAIRLAAVAMAWPIPELNRSDYVTLPPVWHDPPRAWLKDVRFRCSHPFSIYCRKAPIDDFGRVNAQRIENAGGVHI